MLIYQLLRNGIAVRGQAGQVPLTPTTSISVMRTTAGMCVCVTQVSQAKPTTIAITKLMTARYNEIKGFAAVIKKYGAAYTRV